MKLSADDTAASDLSKASNVAFMKGKCVSGRAEGVVVRVGNETVTGRIQYVFEHSQQNQKGKRGGKGVKDVDRKV